jgi:hypothetical protein
MRKIFQILLSVAAAAALILALFLFYVCRQEFAAGRREIAATLAAVGFAALILSIVICVCLWIEDKLSSRDKKLERQYRHTSWTGGEVAAAITSAATIVIGVLKAAGIGANTISGRVPVYEADRTQNIELKPEFVEITGSTQKPRPQHELSESAISHPEILAFASEIRSKYYIHHRQFRRECILLSIKTKLAQQIQIQAYKATLEKVLSRGNIATGYPKNIDPLVLDLNLEFAKQLRKHRKLAPVMKDDEFRHEAARLIFESRKSGDLENLSVKLDRLVHLHFDRDKTLICFLRGGHTTTAKTAQFLDLTNKQVETAMDEIQKTVKTVSALVEELAKEEGPSRHNRSVKDLLYRACYNLIVDPKAEGLQSA